MIKNIGFAVTGSFCMHKKILKTIKSLKTKGYNILPIVSQTVFYTDTKFGKSKDFIAEIESITENKVIKTITEAEPIGPKSLIDILIVAPCTGNTLSKISNAITDNAVTMAVKSHLRQNKPVLIGVSSNDALGKNSENLGRLINSKNIFFIPFGQDDYINKPNSLISEWSLTEKAMLEAEKGQQLQPIIISYA